MAGVPGLIGIELLRPVGDDSRYLVYTRWDSDELATIVTRGPDSGEHAQNFSLSASAESRPIGTPQRRQLSAGV